MFKYPSTFLKDGMQKFYSNCVIIIFSLALSLTGTANTFNLTYFSIDNPKHSHHPNKSLVIQKNTPITTDEENAWFSDMRMKLDISNTTSHNEVNLGIAHRKSLPHQENTIGTYAFWDISHIKDQVFAQQTTLGVEWLNLNTHIATNLYLPLSSFTTDLQYWDSLPQERDWRHTQQAGLLGNINTLAGADINLSKSVVLNPAQKIGVDVQYGYFTSTKHTEQGPTIGLVLTNKSSRQQTNYQLFGSYNSYHKTSLGVRTETQWLNNNTLKHTSSSSNISPLIKRDIDIRTTPVDERPFLLIKTKLTYPSENQEVWDYVRKKFQVKLVAEDYSEPYDLLLLGSKWCRFNVEDVKTFQEKAKNEIDLIHKEQAKIKIFSTAESDNSTPYTFILDELDLMVGFNYTDNPKYFRSPLVYWWNERVGKEISLNYNYENIKANPQHNSIIRRDSCQPTKPYFACMLASYEKTPKNFELASERLALFDELSKYKFIASGGKARNNIPMIGRGTPSTLEFINSCKFMIAYENKAREGYITEKVFNSWLGGALPIYNGHESAKNDINMNAVIMARDFESQHQLIEEIKRLDRDDNAYCAKWNNNIINKKNQEYEYYHEKLYNKLDSIFTEKLGFPGQ